MRLHCSSPDQHFISLIYNLSLSSSSIPAGLERAPERQASPAVGPAEGVVRILVHTGGGGRGRPVKTVATLAMIVVGACGGGEE
jgi:hypothetical protein